MAFNLIKNNDIANYSDVNDNFYYIAQGSRIPLSQSSKGYLEYCNATNNLGSSATTWKTAYGKNFYHTSITCSKLNVLIAEETILATTGTISFSGLRTDVDELFIIGYVKQSYTNGVSSIRFGLNADSTTSYDYTRSTFQDAVINSSITNTGATALIGVMTADSATAVINMFTMNIILPIKNSYGKLCTSFFSGANCYNINYISSVWINTIDAVSSVEFLADDTKFDPGTHIILYGVLS